jgi:hypothetical protein
MRRSALLLLATTQLLTGCAMTFDASKVGVPVTMASPADAPAQGERFKVQSTAVYGLWGIATMRRPSVERTLRSQLLGAKEIRDVRIKVKSRVGDVLVSVLTLGLIVPRSVEMEGVVVGGPSPTAPVAAPSPGAVPAPAPATGGQPPAPR